MSEFHEGKLLVATPAITESTFARSVVLICVHNEEGAFGLILNQPLDDVPVAEQLPAWDNLVVAPSVFFRGGPVEPAAGFGLGKWAETPAVENWTPLMDRVALLNLSEPPEEAPNTLEQCRLFAGYSGWEAGQLETEIEDRGWFVVPAEPGDLFAERPEDLWKSVLFRQTGEMKLYAYFPADPRAN